MSLVQQLVRGAIREIADHFIASLRPAEPAVALNPRLLEAVKVAEREFGAGSSHAKAVTRILATLEGVDANLLLRGDDAFNRGQFVVVLTDYRGNGWEGCCALIVGQPDSDTDAALLGVRTTAGLRASMARLVHQRTPCVRLATAEEVEAAVALWTNPDNVPALMACRARIVDCHAHVFPGDA